MIGIKMDIYCPIDNIIIRPIILTIIVYKLITVLKIIMGFIYPTSGTISIDGQSYDEIDIDKLKESISYATQGASVYQDTAFNNITMYDDSISKEKVESACYASCFDEVIKKYTDLLKLVVNCHIYRPLSSRMLHTHLYCLMGAVL